MDANGDVTVAYQGFGPDVSDELIATPDVLALLQNEISPTVNPDLQAYWTEIENVLTVVEPLPNNLGDSNGNVDGKINEILLYATNNGATDAQVGRLRAILYNVLGLLDGDANGVMDSTFDADTRLQGQASALNSDNVLNATRSGNDEVDIIDINQRVNGGTFSIRLYNNALGTFQDIPVPIAVTGTAPNVVLDPAQTALNIENALDASKLVGINWPVADNYEGPVQVRYIDPAEVASSPTPAARPTITTSRSPSRAKSTIRRCSLRRRRASTA
jgi:hypothetical protein